MNPKQDKAKKHTPRHIIGKLPKTKDKEKNLESGRTGTIPPLRGETIQMTMDFSSEVTKAKRHGTTLFRS